jgi:hypothetical protein
MQPTWMQRVFARHIPGLVALIVITLAVTIWIGIGLLPLVIFEPTVWSVIRFGLLMTAALVMGFFVAVLAISIFIPPLYHWRASLNGAPFKVGDHVRILAGRHRDRVVRIYAIWESRDEGTG